VIEFRLAARSNVPPYLQLVEQVRQALRMGLLEAGDQLPTVRDAALNERDYGDLMGINKEDARKRWGDQQVHLWQRSYEIAPPGGESLKDTEARVIPFYEKRISPELHAGKSVLVVAHGNSLRTLIMRLDRLSPEQVMEVELATGMPLIYRFNTDGSVAEKSDLAA